MGERGEEAVKISFISAVGKTPCNDPSFAPPLASPRS